MRSSFFKSFAAKLAAAALLAACACVSASAQDAQPPKGRLKLDSLERLTSKAEEKVEIEIDGALMKFAASLLSSDDPDERAVKEVVVGLKGVYVRSYESKAGAQFTDADLAPLREQLRGQGWSRIVDVKSRDEGDDNAEIYVLTEGESVEGMTILTFESKELTVINIVGSIDPNKLRLLEGTLGIPHIHKEHKKQK
ncbi:MAG TPA: DUF4252 domain-containing protein [Pyrinomonadaceae bacterium]|jgi:hypothetical protein|nr:DUF4252 domain-containing protein [Pyrinomonadaceae bacterium]